MRPFRYHFHQLSVFLTSFGCLFFAGIGAGTAQDKLTIVSWGGAYEHSQREAYFKPFSAMTGTQIEVKSYDGGIEELRQQVESGEPDWDLIDLEIADNMLACDLGLLEPIDHSILSPAPDGTSALEDFAENTLTTCGVPQIVSATVLAFDSSAFPGEKPTSIKDLFDIKKFPGRRALQKKPIANLEWALLSYDIPIQDLYALLSTERGLDLAFRKLDSIKEHIVWWTEGSAPPDLLADADVVMASGYNGRLFNAAKVENQPIEIIWEGQLHDYATWGIAKGSNNTKIALEFINFATSTQRLADQSRYIAYGPARKSAAKLVWQHTESGVDIRPHLPTYAANAQHAIRKDQVWYAKTKKRLENRFSAWIAQ